MFRKQFQKDYKGSKGEVNKSPSLTVPDDTLTIRQIIDRYTKGLSAPIMFDKVYSEDNPDIRGLDIVELKQLAEENQSVINKHLENQRIAKQKAEQAERLEFEKYKLEKQKQEQSKTE